jgi:hypothetical protein
MQRLKRHCLILDIEGIYSLQPRTRIFVYGSQGSGSSLFTYFLAQMPNSAAVIDLWTYEVIPVINAKVPIILKCTVSNLNNFQENFTNFNPSFSILYIRNPVDIYLSLNRKQYRDVGGKAEEKLKLLDSFYKNKASYFNIVIHYEDFIPDPPGVIRKLKGKVPGIPKNAHLFNRSLDEIIKYTGKHIPWCKENYKLRWGYGNIHLDKLKRLKPISNKTEDKTILSKILTLCPTIMKYYGNDHKGTAPPAPGPKCVTG